jgi:hypothetical protein
MERPSFLVLVRRGPGLPIQHTVAADVASRAEP